MCDRIVPTSMDFLIFLCAVVLLSCFEVEQTSTPSQRHGLVCVHVFTLCTKELLSGLSQFSEEVCF